MKIRLAAALILATLTIQAVTGCSDTGKPDDTTSAETTVPVTADAIGKAIADELGDTYAVDSDISREFLDEIYGVKSEWVDELYAKQAAIGYTGDLLIVVKAASGKAADVKAALEDYAEYNRTNAVIYPANQPKVNAAQVYSSGDYVFYIMLGVMDYSTDADVEANYEIAKEANDKAVAVIKTLLT